MIEIKMKKWAELSKILVSSIMRPFRPHNLQFSFLLPTVFFFFSLLNFFGMYLQTNSLRFSDLMYKNYHFYIIGDCNLTCYFQMKNFFSFINTWNKKHEIKCKNKTKPNHFASHTLYSLPLFFMLSFLRSVCTSFSFTKWK